MCAMGKLAGLRDLDLPPLGLLWPRVRPLSLPLAPPSLSLLGGSNMTLDFAIRGGNLCEEEEEEVATVPRSISKGLMTMET